ncbi:hypothetical protein D3C80_1501470 [compost metagenome]
MTVGFNLQNQLDEIAQLQRLPEGFWRLMGNHIAVFRYRQQLIATTFADLVARHFTRQAGKALNMQADGVQHDINRFQELIAVQIVQNGQVNAGTTLGHFGTHPVETFFQQQREIHRQVGIAGGHIAFGFDNPGFQ